MEKYSVMIKFVTKKKNILQIHIYSFFMHILIYSYITSSVILFCSFFQIKIYKKMFCIFFILLHKNKSVLHYRHFKIVALNLLYLLEGTTCKDRDGFNLPKGFCTTLYITLFTLKMYIQLTLLKAKVSNINAFEGNLAYLFLRNKLNTYLQKKCEICIIGSVFSYLFGSL